ncbi:MAG: hypothetical protein ACLFV7_10700 [Phycisphaerae bacterium]
MKRLSVIWTLAASICVGCQTDTRPDKPGVPLHTEVRRDEWKLGYTTGHILRTRRYRIFTTVKRALILQKVPAFLEASYSNYLELTGLEARPVDQCMNVYVMASRQEWSNLTEHVIGRTIPLQAGGYCYEKTCFFWDIGLRGTLSVAAHEGFHQFFRHQMEDQLPMWLEEGLCTLAEGFQLRGDGVVFTPDDNPGRFNNLRAAIVERHWLDLPVLLSRHSQEAVSSDLPEQAVGYYGQLWALMRYIRSNPKYSRGLTRLLQDARAGRLHQSLELTRAGYSLLRRQGLLYNRTVSVPLFRKYIASDLDAFQREYTSYARKLVMIDGAGVSR